MKYYAGLDVSMKETFICIVDGEGKRVYESQAYTAPKPIHDELTKNRNNFILLGKMASIIRSLLLFKF